MISRCGVIPAASCRSSLGSGILLACASRGRCSFPKVTRFVVRLKLLELVTLMIVQRGCMRGCIPRPTSYTSSKVTAPDVTDCDSGKASAAGCDGFTWHCMVLGVIGVYMDEIIINIQI